MRGVNSVVTLFKYGLIARVGTSGDSARRHAVGTAPLFDASSTPPPFVVSAAFFTDESVKTCSFCMMGLLGFLSCSLVFFRLCGPLSCSIFRWSSRPSGCLCLAFVVACSRRVCPFYSELAMKRVPSGFLPPLKRVDQQVVVGCRYPSSLTPRPRWMKLLW